MQFCSSLGNKGYKGKGHEGFLFARRGRGECSNSAIVFLEESEIFLLQVGDHFDVRRRFDVFLHLSNGSDSHLKWT